MENILDKSKNARLLTEMVNEKPRRFCQGFCKAVGIGNYFLDTLISILLFCALHSLVSFSGQTGN